jgi:hypothetical protein
MRKKKMAKKTELPEDAAEAANAPKLDAPAQEGAAPEQESVKSDAPPAEETAACEPPVETSTLDPQSIGIVEDAQPVFASPLEHLTAVAYSRFRIGQGNAGAFQPWSKLTDSEKGLLSKGALHVFTGGEARTDFERAVFSVIGG